MRWSERRTVVRFTFGDDFHTSTASDARPRPLSLIWFSLDAMRVSNMTHGRLPENRIVAEPPLAEPPFDPKEPLPVSRTRVCIGVLLLISGFAVGSSSSFLPAAKL